MVETIITLLQKKSKAERKCPWTDKNDRKKETEVKKWKTALIGTKTILKKAKNNSEKQNRFWETKNGSEKQNRFWETKSYGTAIKKGLTLRGHAGEEAENY